MSTKAKLLAKLKSLPRDFSYNELEKLMGLLGYKQYSKGKTSGSRVAFVRASNEVIQLHKPHEKNVKVGCLKDVLQKLEEYGDLEERGKA